jgi:FtsX-like permease family
MDRIAAALAAQYTGNADLGAHVLPLADQMVRGVRTALLVLLAAVGFVVLIACANVTNLLLTRATGRQREVAIRAALGASRLRLIRQFLTETIVLYTLGGAAALALAAWGLDAVKALDPGRIPRFGETSLDGRVLAATVFVSLFTAVLFGLAPAVHAANGDVGEALKAGDRSGASHMRERLRALLIVAEVALSVVLLIGGRSRCQLYPREPGSAHRSHLGAAERIKIRGLRPRGPPTPSLAGAPLPRSAPAGARLWRASPALAETGTKFSFRSALRPRSGGFVDLSAGRYSARSAMAGSTRAARRAGT